MRKKSYDLIISSTYQQKVRKGIPLKSNRQSIEDSTSYSFFLYILHEMYGGFVAAFDIKDILKLSSDIYTLQFYTQS